jgi:hypothetical protein
MVGFVGKIYPVKMTTRCFEYFAISRALYTHLCKDYQLPSVRTFTRITSKFKSIDFQHKEFKPLAERIYSEDGGEVIAAILHPRSQALRTLRTSSQPWPWDRETEIDHLPIYYCNTQSSVTGPSDPPYVVPWPWDRATEIDHLPIYYRRPTNIVSHGSRWITNVDKGRCIGFRERFDS